MKVEDEIILKVEGEIVTNGTEWSMQLFLVPSLRLMKTNFIFELQLLKLRRGS